LGLNSSEVFKALVAATSAIIAKAKYKYAIISLYMNLTSELRGVNEAQRSERPNERIVRAAYARIYQLFYAALHNLVDISLLNFDMGHLMYLPFF
jgi:hypothetical protein